MIQVSPEEVQRHLEHLHGVKARLVKTELVRETYKGETAWEGLVYVFDIDGHSQASACYAWSSPIEGSKKRRFYAVLKIPPVASPQEAVRASIIHDYKSGKIS